ncbi:sensor histidine kinase [Paenibacillus illinoisensis]|uniref:sensor histidine kinase n=1 Tax=Paenibacillus illinoisensis TaxID=59845 RepID=UPI001C8ED5E3|nr:ATP-binding protein [Paenibacillus illinoisensis]MBY0217761.1 GHKL domain-containing protein [Paenibacillus illinoisensis]
MKVHWFKSKQVEIIFLVVALLLTILGLLNYSYYNGNREVLMYEQVETMQAVAINLSKSIQLSYKEEGFVEDPIDLSIMPTSLEEVTVFDPSAFNAQQEKLEDRMYTQGILYGTYKYHIKEDYDYVSKAYETNNELSLETEIDGKSLLKTYFPHYLDYPVIISLVSDLSEINSYTDSFLLKMQLLTGVSIVLVLIGLIIKSRYYTSNKNMAIQAEQTSYIENMDQLFTLIKEQRHDFNNQMSTIQSLVVTEQYDDLRKFTDEMIGEATLINDIIKINSPALTGLIQAKIIYALKQKITFTYDFINIQKTNLDTIKSTDLVKIMSNLIDNAFDAVQALPEKERTVELTGYLEDDRMIFNVFSSGKPISEQLIEQIFEKGFSTKMNNENHSGLGLYIVQKIIKQYHGRITVNPKTNGNTFTISIPI